MSSATISQEVSDAVNYVLGVSTSAGDAINSIQQAKQSDTQSDQLIAQATATTDVIQMLSSSGQQALQKFSPYSVEAADLLANVSNTATVVGATIVIAPIYKTIKSDGPGSITSGQISSFTGSAIAAGALVAPELAIPLAVAATAFIAYGWLASDPNYTISNALNQLKSLVQPIYNSLSAADQASFATSLANSMQLALDGGMVVPQVDEFGQVTSYSLQVPTSVTTQMDGSTLYTFASGATYVQSTNVQGALWDTSANGGENVWTLPQENGTNPTVIVTLPDGSFSQTFIDPTTNLNVAEVYVAGTSGTYTASTAGATTFITDAGSNNQVNATAGSLVNNQGNNNTFVLDNGTITVGSADLTTTVSGNNTLINATAGDNFALSGVGYTVNLVDASGSVVTWSADSGGTVNAASGDTINATTGDSISFSGDGIILNATGGQYDFSGTGSTINASNSDISIESGGNGTLAGSGNTLVLATGSAVTLDSSDSNEIYNEATGQTLSFGNGTFTLDGVTYGAGATDTVTSDSDSGAMQIALFDGSGLETNNATFDASGALLVDRQFSDGVLYDTVNYSDGAISNVEFYDPSGVETQDQSYSDGYVSSAINYSNGVETDQVFYNASGRVTADALFNTAGQQTDYDVYDPSTGQLVQDQQIVNGYIADAIDYANGVKTGETFYNAAQQVTGQIQFNVDGSQTQTFYDPSTGALTGENFVNPDGSQIDYAINADGSQTATVLNATGQETEQVQFDTDGSQIKSFYDPSTGKETGEDLVNADGSQDDYTFNPDGSQTAMAFNAKGQETEWAQFSADGSADEKFYDPATGIETGEDVIGADGSQDDYTFSADGTQTMNAYNAYGQQTGWSQVNADGSSTAISYDPGTGVKTGETDIAADGSRTDYTYGTDGSETATVYNSAGQETEFAQTDGTTTTYDYFDGNSPYAYGQQVYDDGNLVEQNNYDPTTGNISQSMEYTGGVVTSETWYDSQGNETQSAQVNSDGSVTYDLFSGNSPYAYEQQTYNGSTLVQQNEYDPDTGHISQSMDYTNGVATSETLYDSNGNETQYQELDGSTLYVDDFTPGSPHASTEYVYDNGALVEQASYDASTGLMTQDVQYSGGMESSVTNYTNGVASNETWYDSNGNETQYEEVDGNMTFVDDFYPGLPYAQYQYTYDGGTLVEEDWFNDQTGALEQTVQYSGNSVTLSTYGGNPDDSAGQMTSQTEWVNGSETQYTFFDGDVTYVNNFSTGAQYSFQQNVYVDNVLTEQDSFDQTTGELTEVALFGSGPYPYEVEIANGGPYFSEIENVDPSSGNVYGFTMYNPQTGAETGFDNGGGYETVQQAFGNLGYGYGSGSGYNSGQIGGLSGWGVTVFEGGYGGGIFGGYGFAGPQSTVENAVNRSIGQIALSDLQQGNSAGVAAAEAALLQARQSADSVASSGSVLEGAKWDSQIVTWSLAGPDGSTAESAEEAAAQQAFATWAAASGLTFEEVTDPAQADINIGWSDLGTSTSGVVGYTTFQAQGGAMVAGSAAITLEDPSEDALVAGTDGQLTYSGTDATLEQVLLHEIGHAIGLADTSDPASIMYYELTASNRGLDSADISGIHTLYADRAAATASAAAASQVSRLIQAMAAYAPAAPAAMSAGSVLQQNQQTLLAASAH